MSFARINPDGLEWQKKLEPRKAEMEAALAKLAGPPYEARSVTFHLPDFIDIVLNAGEARNPLGAAIGESLPNFGPGGERRPRAHRRDGQSLHRPRQRGVLEDDHLVAVLPAHHGAGGVRRRS